MNSAIRQTEGLNQGKWELLNEDDYLDLYSGSEGVPQLSRKNYQRE